MSNVIRNTIAIDFDGVIHQYSKGWEDGSIYDRPVKGTKWALMNLLNNYHIYIFTTRDVNDVVKWMNSSKFWEDNVVQCEHGFNTIAMPEGTKFWQGGMFKVAVSNRKLPAEFYIDDRGICFKNWDETLKEIKLKGGAK